MNSSEPDGPLAGRAGYDEGFLGPLVPLPAPARAGVETVVLPYTHFSVALRPDRRLAAAAAVCVDGRALVEDAAVGEGWAYDPRVPAEVQAGDEVYRNNSLERGHLVPWHDAAWGPAEAAHRAAADASHYPNAAPQADVFNQDMRLWQGLEHHLLDHPAVFDRRLVVLTGPVLQDSDPPYRGVQVPLRFWKVAAFMLDGALAATGFVLDQSPDLARDADRALLGATAGAPPPLGAFRLYQAPVSDIAEITELEFGPLPDVDLMPPPRAPEDRWRRLESYEDIVIEP
ncbi:DNA/RNA non-specific endonuclease [Streptomyces sp. NPDC048604]|uniref:DNA/RNA non-specific endonuclease n=1 Tax=Streptomyces sp. NPDC048604 TaxID=3365578 RepID=UPI0037125BB6